MLSKYLWLLPLIAPALAEDTEEIFTVTHTNYVLPSYFKEQIDSALAANPPQQTGGIKIDFVYDDGTPKSTLLTSRIPYTVSTDIPQSVTVTSCEGTDCTTAVTTTSVPHFYTTYADQVYSVPAQQQNGQNEQDPEEDSTLFEYDTVTQDETVSNTNAAHIAQYTEIAESAVTVTETLFTASTKPSTSYVYSTSDVPVPTNSRNPLVTGSVVSSKLSNTIKTSQFTEDTVTIGSLIQQKAVNASSHSIDSSRGNSSAPVSVLPSTTSTIDLRISSSAIAQEAGASATRLSSLPFKFSNHSTSDTESSSAEASLSSDFASLTSGESSESSSVSEASAESSLISSSSDVKSSSAPESSVASSSAAQESGTGKDIPSGAGSASSANIFSAISKSEPLSVFKREALPLGLPQNVDNDGLPYQTNKFSTNLILSEQTDMIWSYPYGMFWKKVDYFGWAVQHTNPSNRVFGPKNKNTPGDAYFFNPTQNAELLISATDLTKDNNHISVSDMKTMSALVKLAPQPSFSSDYIELPIVQGMGFVTAIYHGDLTVELNTLIGISSVKEEKSTALPANTKKFRFTLFNDLEYLVYATLPAGISSFNLNTKDSFHIEGSKSVNGLVLQVAVAPKDGSQDSYYDQAAGIYPVSASLAGSASGSSAQYSFKYQTKGSSKSGNTLVFALPHHLNSLTGSTKSSATPIQLESTTKGTMQAFLTNELQMSEAIEPNVSFLPWSPSMTKSLTYTKEQLSLLAKTAQEELSADIKSTVANMNSNYFSGKVLDKYAQILLVVHDIIQDKDAAKEALNNLKTAFKVFTSNQQYYPLMYDTKFKGITSTSAQGGDTGADYGSAYYNDHHFHYGYFIHAAAVVGYVDEQLGGTWAKDNQEWVNNLIRDVANPSEDDTYFPVSRMFDWFAGHSWAGGLFSAGDGRNQESSSEDYHFTYGMKLWGKVVGDNAMQARGDLMLAIQKRALNDYYLYSDGNSVVPSQIVPNRVAGIFFDNKIAYTTYFGGADEHPEYVHGIHMLPLTAASALIRGATFAKQEWDSIISKIIGSVDSGWTGILRLNQALFDAKSAYEFFSSANFKSTYLDNGQSRTWSLAFAGGLANSS